MSIIFQLFRADDLNLLDEKQLVELKEIVAEEMRELQDTSLESFIAVSKHIKNVHMTRLLPDLFELRQRKAEEPALRRLDDFQLRKLIERGERQESVKVKEESKQYPPEDIDRLKRRAHEVFRELMPGELPEDRAPTFSESTGYIPDLLDQLLSPADLAKLKERLGTKGHVILAWALTCELANLKTYKALQKIRERTEAKFMEFTKQRAKGPDSYYSPFYPLHPLNVPPYLGQP